MKKVYIKMLRIYWYVSVSMSLSLWLLLLLLLLLVCHYRSGCCCCYYRCFVCLFVQADLIMLSKTVGLVGARDSGFYVLISNYQCMRNQKGLCPPTFSLEECIDKKV